MKTPVSILQEYMVNQDEELIYVASENIDPILKRSVFSYELSLYGGVYIAQGSGLSKQIAKQETARNMLLKLAKDRSNVQVLLDKNNMGATSMDYKQLLKPCEKSSTRKKGPPTKTPVSILEEYLVVVPNYLYSKTVSKSPSSSTVSFHCSLDLFDGKYHAEATALTKQEAKQKTAKNMLILLSREKQRLRHLLELSEDLGADYFSRLLQDKDDRKFDGKITTESSPVAIETNIENLGLNEAQITCQACSNKGEIVAKRVVHNDHVETDKKGELNVAEDRSTEKISVNTKYTPSDGKESLVECNSSEKSSESILDKKSRGTVDELCQGFGSSIKTPVSLLQEYLVQLQDSNYLPNYIFSKDKSNPSWFHCKIDLCNGKYSAEATGLTKKQTKHKTAHEMLVQLSKDSPVVRQLLKMNKFHEQEDDDVINDIKNNDTAAPPSDTLEISNNPEHDMKTPVSLLQEYLSDQRLKPYYVSCELPTKPSEPRVYQYELTVNLFNKEFHTKASAQSKKLAKHETAKNMLLKISEVSAELKDLLERNDYYEKMEKVCSSNKNSIVRNNPIFQLDTFCRYHNFRSPEYTLIEESGKIFTMKCQVEYIIVEGTGTKIQGAKHDSAANMLIRLQEELKRIELSEKSPQKVERTEIRFSDVDQELQEMIDEVCGKVESNQSDHPSSAIHKEHIPSIDDDSNSAFEKSNDSNVLVDDERGYYRSTIRKSTIPKVSSEADGNLPKVEIMKVELDNIKIVHGGKTKSPDTVKSHLSKYQKSLVSLDLNQILKQVKVNKGFAEDDNEGFFQYLEEASVEDLRCMVDVIKCHKGILIDLIQFRTCTPDNICDTEEFVTNCKLRASNEHSPLNFKSTAQDKDESERKALVPLLKYLSTLKA